MSFKIGQLVDDFVVSVNYCDTFILARSANCPARFAVWNVSSLGFRQGMVVFDEAEDAEQHFWHLRKAFPCAYMRPLEKAERDADRIPSWTLPINIGIAIGFISTILGVLCSYYF